MESHQGFLTELRPGEDNPRQREESKGGRKKSTSRTGCKRTITHGWSASALKKDGGGGGGGDENVGPGRAGLPTEEEPREVLPRNQGGINQ